MKMRFLGVLLVSILIAFPVTAQGSIPMLINHQGRLMSPDMAPIVGAETIKFTIYDQATSGNELWMETHAVSLDEGFYSVLLGSQTDLTFDVFEGNEVYLGIKVGTDEEIQPRFKVSSVPYAMFAGEAATVGGLGSTDISNLVNNHDHDSRYFTQTQLGTSGGGGHVHWANLVGIPVAITDTNIGHWNQAYGWGNHATAGYIKSYTETDPLYVASPAHGITNAKINEWSLAYGWGNHASAGYIKSYSETDPVFLTSPAHGITSTLVGQWNQAFGWGNHANGGYLTAEADTLASVTGRGASTSSLVTFSGGAAFPGSGIWTASGKVGIGTINPTNLLTITSPTEAYPLNVSTAHSSVTGILLGNSGLGGKNYAIATTSNGATTGGGYFGFVDRDESAWRLIIDKTGNVGIGTTNPTNLLTITSPTEAYPLKVDTSNSYVTGILLGNSALGGKNYAIHITANYATSGGGNFAIIDKDASASRLLISRTGNVGIGTTSPNSTLHIGSGYVQLPLTSGAPPASDCDSATEHGRMKVDATGGKLWICMASGWVAK